MSLTSRRTAMARKRYKPEEIVAKLRQVDVLVSQGQNMVDAIRQIGVSEVTYYRWRQEFGGLKSEQVKRLKDLELVAMASALDPKWDGVSGCAGALAHAYGQKSLNTTARTLVSFPTRVVTQLARQRN